MGKSKELAELGDVVTQSGGKVGIGTSSPDVQDQSANNLVVEDPSGHGGITIKTPSSYWGSIHFSDGTGADAYRGIVGYNHADNSLNFSTDTTTRMTIDASGRVTMPYQVSFMAVSGSGFNTNGYLNSFGSVYHNVGGHLNNSNGLFTAPVSGTYIFVAGILVASGTGRLEFKLNCNGVSYVAGNGTGTVYDGPTITAMVQLNANDYVRVDRVSGTAYNDGGHNNTYFGGYLLG